ncbi:hypothetical protein ACH4UM_37880 [Streptomyces sp. NPDC020801]|uniref:hypothetical protein n=1 Tax=Streptomyces sp. NPDC020801 TaxID=3365093 RepID=UPI0037AD6E5F
MTARLLHRRTPDTHTVEAGHHTGTVTITPQQHLAHTPYEYDVSVPQAASGGIFAPGRPARALLAWTLVLLAVAAVAALLPLCHGVPDIWWPHTGNAFTPHPTTPAHSDPCDLIVGPAKAYCRRNPGRELPGPRQYERLAFAAAVLTLIVIALRLRRRGQR